MLARRTAFLLITIPVLLAAFASTAPAAEGRQVVSLYKVPGRGYRLWMIEIINATGRCRRLLDAEARTVEELRLTYPREIELYRRDAGDQADLLHAPSHVTWQLFLADYAVPEPVRREVLDQVERFADRDPQVRDQASDALCEPRLLLPLLKLEPTLPDLSPEQEVRVAAVRKKCGVLTAEQVVQLRDDTRFLRDALAKAEGHLRQLVARRLTELAATDASGAD
jgi:hypothetical protein